jgi:hypothetical protein
MAHLKRFVLVAAPIRVARTSKAAALGHNFVAAVLESGAHFSGKLNAKDANDHPPNRKKCVEKKPHLGLFVCSSIPNT